MKRETYIDLDAAGRAAFIDAQIMWGRAKPPRHPLAAPFEGFPFRDHRTLAEIDDAKGAA